MPSSSLDAHLAGGTNKAKERRETTIKLMLDFKNCELWKLSNLYDYTWWLGEVPQWKAKQTQQCSFGVKGLWTTCAYDAASYRHKETHSNSPHYTAQVSNSMHVNSRSPSQMENQFKQTATVVKLFSEKMHRVKISPLRDKEENKQKNKTYAQVTSVNKSRPQFWPTNYF